VVRGGIRSSNSEHRAARRRGFEVVGRRVGRETEHAGDERPSVGDLMPEGAQDRAAFVGRELGELDAPLSTAWSGRATSAASAVRRTVVASGWRSPRAPSG
jgi:hypothetical protein